MKVRDLIEDLQRQDPDLEVDIHGIRDPQVLRGDEKVEIRERPLSRAPYCPEPHRN